jgi:MYXO-CTERM domain-containing protein
MKSIRTTLLAASMLAGGLNAATTTYTWTTGTTATSNGIANAAGVQYQNSASPSFAGAGTISWGYFNITDAEISAATSASTLTSAFQNWNSTTGTFAAAGPSGNRGTFNFNAAARDLAGSGFSGKNMYVFVGGGSTYALSNEYLVLKTTFTFDPLESGPTAFVKTITNTNATPLFGTTTSNVFTTTTDSSTTPGWRTAVVIPEPSAALLGALGALGLLRRRRN